MEIKWFEGFEHYQLADGTAGVGFMTQGLWTTISLGSGGKIQTEIVRTGSYAFQLGTLGYMRRSFADNLAYPGCTFGLYMKSLPTRNDGGMILAQFRDSANHAHVGIKIGTTGRIIACLGGLDANLSSFTVLGQSTLEIATGAWNHIETKVKLHASAGYVKVKVNGRVFLSLTGINTIGPLTTENTAAQIAFGWFDGSKSLDYNDGLYFDDIVQIKWAEDGTEDTNYLGMYGVYYLKPNADTATKDWSLTSGSNGYALIDEIQPDDDLNFLFASATGKKSSFDVQPLPLNITSVAAVAPIARMRKTDTGVGSVALGVISSSTEDEATDHPLTTAYQYYYDVWQLDPASSAAWNPLAMPEIQVDRSE